jgi:uncharacterized protein (TIGR02466 family)
MLPELDFGRLEHSAIFPSPLTKYVWPDTDNFNRELVEVILTKEKQNPGLATTNVGGWHSEKNFQHWEEECATLLLNRITSLCAAMLERVIGWSTNINDWNVQAWANINRLGDYNKFHHHIRNANLLSGVYYASTGIEATDRVQPAVITFVDQYRLCGLNKIRAVDTFDVRPEPGLMLVFPSSLTHRVQKHRGSGNRVSVAFNLANKNFTTINYKMKEYK